jgi:RimJ/RimL family protein N-acetyltransferase
MTFIATQLLTTPRLLLRPWRESDRTPFAALNADPKVMEFMPCLLSREQSDDFFDRIQAHFARYGYGLYAAEHRATGEFIGFIGLLVPAFDAPFMPAVEIGWRLAAKWWGQGFATEGGREIVRYAFDVIGLDQLVSFTAITNARSRRVMQKLGMTHDPAENFEHPRVPPGHPLRPHVLYRLERAKLLALRPAEYASIVDKERKG